MIPSDRLLSATPRVCQQQLSSQRHSRHGRLRRWRPTLASIFRRGGPRVNICLGQWVGAVGCLPARLSDGVVVRRSSRPFLVASGGASAGWGQSRGSLVGGQQFGGPGPAAWQAQRNSAASGEDPGGDVEQSCLEPFGLRSSVRIQAGVGGLGEQALGEQDRGEPSPVLREVVQREVAKVPVHLPGQTLPCITGPARPACHPPGASRG